MIEFIIFGIIEVLHSWLLSNLMKLVLLFYIRFVGLKISLNKAGLVDVDMNRE